MILSIAKKLPLKLIFDYQVKYVRAEIISESEPTLLEENMISMSSLIRICRGFVKEECLVINLDYFSCFSLKTYVVGTH